MTKEEAINFINECSELRNDKPYGFMVVAISREDIEIHQQDFLERFDNLSDENKERVVSVLADHLSDMFVDWDLGQNLDDSSEELENIFSEIE
jgi:hypothetical protein